VVEVTGSFHGDSQGRRRLVFASAAAPVPIKPQRPIWGNDVMSFSIVVLLASCAVNTEPVAPSEARLQAAAAYSKACGGQTMVVLFNGKRVFEQYDNGGAVDKLQGLVSGVKSFVGVAAIAAVEDGLIRLDGPASENIPEWRDDPAKAKITYRQLLNMTSGMAPLDRSGAAKAAPWPAWKEIAQLPMAARPGERFQYGAYQLNTFAYALERELGGETFEEYLKRRILEPIDVKLQWRLRCADGHPQVGGGGYMLARDWAAFGEFVRRMGNWQGKQIVDGRLLAECFQGSGPNPAYGLTWWLKKRVPGASVSEIPILSQEWGAVANSDWLAGDLAAGFGGGKQRLFVVPSLGLVIVRQGSQSQGFADIEFLGLLLRGKSADK
jgi:CubicO group peptidase (beta-lactamase class C family)